VLCANLQLFEPHRSMNPLIKTNNYHIHASHDRDPNSSPATSSHRRRDRASVIDEGFSARRVDLAAVFSRSASALRASSSSVASPPPSTLAIDCCTWLCWFKP